ncbi:MAG: glycosyltransferase family 4 protein [Nitrososphaera sp.]
MQKFLKVGLLHNTLNVMGGAERFTLDLIPMLHERCMQVNLATFDKVRWEAVRRMFGEVEMPDDQISLLPFRLRLFGIYQRILMKLLTNKLRRKSDVLVNTHSDHLFCHSDIVYMHGVTPLDGSGVLERYESSLLMKLYFMPYKYLIRSKLKPYTDKDDIIFVANSKFTQERMKRLLKISESRIIYPAVDTDTYVRLSDKTARRDQVVTVGRFTKEKNLQLIPEIASKCADNINFAIVTASAGVNNDLMNKFNEACREYGVESRVTLHMNITFRQKLDILGDSKVYLHLMPSEHFGLALAEACSAGCLPVVLKGGGPEEIVEGIPDSVCDDFDHAPWLVELAIRSWSPEKSKWVSSLMERFSKKNFSDQFCKLIEEVYNRKRRYQ